MTIHRDGWNGPITFECDGCGELLETFEEEFNNARNMMRHESWITRKVKEKWFNFCSKGCWKEFIFQD